jgi:hypothetical protein
MISSLTLEIGFPQSVASFQRDLPHVFFGFFYFQQVQSATPESDNSTGVTSAPVGPC